MGFSSKGATPQNTQTDKGLLFSKRPENEDGQYKQNRPNSPMLFANRPNNEVNMLDVQAPEDPLTVLKQRSDNGLSFLLKLLA